MKLVESQILGKPLFSGFIKSSYSGGSCVAARKLPNGNVEVMNSNNSSDLSLVFTPKEWEAFLLGVHGGQFEMINLDRASLAASDT